MFRVSVARRMDTLPFSQPQPPPAIARVVKASSAWQSGNAGPRYRWSTTLTNMCYLPSEVPAAPESHLPDAISLGNAVTAALIAAVIGGLGWIIAYLLT